MKSVEWCGHTEQHEQPGIDVHESRPMEKMEVEVMERSRRVLVEEHPDTLISMTNLAFTVQGQGRNNEVVKLMSECVRLRSRILGAEHPDTLSSLEALAKWHSAK